MKLHLFFILDLTISLLLERELTGRPSKGLPDVFSLIENGIGIGGGKRRRRRHGDRSLGGAINDSFGMQQKQKGINKKRTMNRR